MQVACKLVLLARLALCAGVSTKGSGEENHERKPWVVRIAALYLPRGVKRKEMLRCDSRWTARRRPVSSSAAPIAPQI